MFSIRHVLLVGHCGADAPRLRRLVERVAGDDVDIEDHASDEQVREAGPDTLLLINRRLGRGFGTGSGIELIAELARRPDPPAMMLVSNYADAQAQAVEMGGSPGFGKSALSNPQTLRRLQEVIHASPAKAPTQER